MVVEQVVTSPHRGSSPEKGTPTPPTTGGSGYAGILKRRWYIVAFVTVLAVAAALAFTFLKTPVYEAQAEVLIQPTSDDLSASTTAAIDPEEVATQARVVTSLPVAKLVVSSLNLSESPTDVLDSMSVAVNGTRVLEVTAERGSASEAARVANAFAESYLSYRRDQVAQQATAIQRDLDELRATVQSDLARVQRKIGSSSGASARYWKVEGSSLLTQLGQTRTALVEHTAEAASLNRGQILLPATPPTSPAGQSPWRIAALVGIIAALLGFGLALLWDRRNGSGQ